MAVTEMLEIEVTLREDQLEPLKAWCGAHLTPPWTLDRIIWISALAGGPCHVRIRVSCVHDLALVRLTYG